MKILHFYKTYFPDTVGGAEQVINQLAVSMKKVGIEVQVLTLCSQPQPSVIEYCGHKVHRIPKSFEIASTSFSFSVINYFEELIKEFDLIHYHYPWPFMDLIHFLKKVNKPTVVTYHSDIIKQKALLKLYKPLQKRFLSSVHRIVATSTNYAQTSPVLSAYRHKTEIIPIGLESETYSVPSLSVLNNWKQKLPERFFLFVGMFRYYKGLEFLLDAAAYSKIPIVIVGTGPSETKLKYQAQKNKLNHVYFTGLLSDEDKSALFMNAYGVVLPSILRSEAFGISLLEGAMYGKPLISCEIGTGTSDINLHQETGLVVKPKDPMALSQAMQFLWDNPEVAKQMGVNAQQRFNSLFTAGQMSERYIQLYKELIEVSDESIAI